MGEFSNDDDDEDDEDEFDEFEDDEFEDDDEDDEEDEDDEFELGESEKDKKFEDKFRDLLGGWEGEIDGTESVLKKLWIAFKSALMVLGLLRLDSRR